MFISHSQGNVLANVECDEIAQLSPELTRLLRVIEPAAGEQPWQPTKEGRVHVRIQSSADIVTARQQGRALASQMGFFSSNLAIIATAISEVARNIVEYAKEGEIIIRLINEGHKRGIEIVAADQGPGIADVSTVMRDGYSTGKRLGIGLPGARRLMDEFEMTSQIGKGTTVRMKKWVA
jgi:serine/threonine-protein kinase RsbT